jgi:hypothetical protein
MPVPSPAPVADARASRLSALIAESLLDDDGEGELGGAGGVRVA